MTAFKSSLPATETADFELLAQKTQSKLKPASRQAFVNIINVYQNQCNPKRPVLVMLDPSIIRYTKDSIEYPLSEERLSAVQRRLRQLLLDENPRPMEVYKAYILYWIKEENDVLWSLRKLMDDHAKWGRKTCKV
ncbi:hypothetical protein CHS0354_025330 [Potamilus streckersoni]|nr:hypothetical protein CHS0354_025330 [Potamilus streckersoni]